MDHYHLFFFILFIPLVDGENEEMFAQGKWTDERDEDYEQVYDSHRCGLPLKVRGEEGPKFKIMGGRGAEEGKLPWAVAIFQKFEGKDIYICTGTLISKRHVMTAAHCFMKPDKKPGGDDEGAQCKIDCCNLDYLIEQEEMANTISVYIGSICLEESGQNYQGTCKSNGREGRHFRVKRGTYEHYFNAKCNYDDFAILELYEDVPAELANHICLLHLHANTSQEEDWRSEAKPVKVYGWGVDGVSDHPMAHLQMLDMPSLWTEEECRRAITEKYKLPFYESMLCTEEKHDANVCQGDSGGGLIAQFEADRRWFLVGIVSFGNDCGILFKNPQKPIAIAQVYTSVYTNRTYIAKWMETNAMLGQANLIATQANQLFGEEDDDENDGMWDWEVGSRDKCLPVD